MTTTFKTAKELMDLFAKLYCHAVVSTDSMPETKEDFAKLANEAEEYSRKLFIDTMAVFEKDFGEKWVIEDDYDEVD